MANPLGAWWGESAKPFFHDLGYTIRASSMLGQAGDEGISGGWRGIIDKATSKAAQLRTARVFAIGGVNAWSNVSASQLWQARLRAFAPAAGLGAGIGVLTSLFDPDDNVFSGALKGAASGLLYNIAGPLVGLDMAVGLGSAVIHGLAGFSTDNSARDITAGMSRYHPVEPSSAESGNLRRRSLMYMAQSRQNVTSFIGGEAAAMHD